MGLNGGDETGRADPAPDDPIRGVRRPRVVVIDDEPAIRGVLVRYARRLGFTAEPADSFEAFQGLLDEETDAVVVDLRMPNVDGLEVVRHLADRGSTAALILTSGYDPRVLRSAERLAMARGLRVAGTLSKPFTIETLQQLFERVASLTQTGTTRAQAPITYEDLSQALKENQLRLHYQPKVDLRSRELVGVEALVRWEHPRLGLVSPALFVPFAEEVGLIDPLTDWVLFESMSQAARWAREGMSLRLSVNCSMRTLQDLDFSQRVVRVAQQVDWPVEQLVLEVTETALAGDVATPLEVLTRLALNGVCLSIDDFGTGYATLDQLDRFPFSELKIDHNFIRRSGADAQTRIIVESSLEMAHRLGLTVVAEGVESGDLWDWVAGCGCDLAQGYFIARPMPAADLEDWAAAWSGGN